MKRINALSEILPYVTAFHGEVFVVKIGGEVCEPECLDDVSRQVSLLHHMGIRVVLVHGGGPQMDALLRRLGVTVEKVGGRRVTNAETLNATKMLYAGQLNTDIVAALRRHGASGVGLTGVDGSIIQAVRRPPRELVDDEGVKRTVDFQFVGDIQSIATRLLEVHLRDGFIPVLSCLGAGPDGQVYNINADTVASAVAQALGAKKLIVMTNVPGILREVSRPESLVSYVDVGSLASYIGSGIVKGGMIPKVEACIDAVRNGVHRTHIIDGTRPGSLLEELFLNEGCGTMIVTEAERELYEKGNRDEIGAPAK